jgi:tetratricopeptide (TPR) repeat protein
MITTNAGRRRAFALLPGKSAFFCRCIAFAIASSTALTAHAFSPSTDITELEWKAWPEFCRIAYIRSGYSAGSPYKRRYSPEVREQGKALLAQVGISGPHHFCTGVVLFQRVQRGSVSVAKRAEYLNLAIGEFEYSYINTNEDHPAYSVVSDYLGRALHLQSSHAKAYGVWHRAIELWPNDPRCYVAMAEALNKDGQPDKALELLERFPNEDGIETKEFLFAKATALHASGRYEEALPIAEALVRSGYAAKGLLQKIISRTPAGVR